MSKKTEVADIECMKKLITQIEALESEKNEILNTLKGITKKRYPSSTKPALNMFRRRISACDAGTGYMFTEASNMLRDGEIVWDDEIHPKQPV